MKNLSTNQEADIVDYIYTLIIENNPWIENVDKRADEVYSNIEELVSEINDRLK